VSLTIPLTVRLKTARSDRHITRDLRDLTFRESAVGGWASATMSLDRPLRLQPDEIAYYANVYIYAGSRTVWEGRLEDPGRGASEDGQIWSLTAMGPAAHARDRTVPLVYVDTSLTDLVRADNVTRGGTNSVGGDPSVTTGTQEALTLQFVQGLGLVANSRVVVRYIKLMETGQHLARLDYTWDSGRTSTSLQVEVVCRTDGVTATGEVARSDNFNTAGAGSSPKLIVTDFNSGRNTAELRIIWTGGAVTVADDVTWASIRNLVIMATRYNKAGTELLTAASYTTNTVLASDVVADLLGRLLTSYDGANAKIAATAYTINQFAYPDGTTAADIFNDLMALEPAYRWGAYESNSVGLYRFEWTTWPTNVRYEADVTDGYDAPGSADGLYNAVRVRWRDAKGAIRSTRRTASVPALTAAGLTREASIDLGDNVGSQAEANQAGDQFLAEHTYAPNAGTLTVARPILDQISGRMVAPWDIKAGELIRVRGILPRIDALNATARDGVTVFRVWSKEYNAANAAATLELDSYSASTARALAQLKARPNTRRR
jgi:hypothetical protein